jgi:hypothetical protein
VCARLGVYAGKARGSGTHEARCRYAPAHVVDHDLDLVSRPDLVPLVPYFVPWHNPEQRVPVAVVLQLWFGMCVYVYVCGSE